MQSSDVYLTVVAASRNDNHGGDMTRRMQAFVDGFIAQCRRHRLHAELILVEWNPPADRPPLEEALVWPADFGPAKVRIVTVPPSVHATFPHASALPLFQMIGKNVGVRRARGQFVLATNVDILFNDELTTYMRDCLRPGTMTRADRYDVPSDIVAGAPFDDVLADCSRRFFKVNTRHGLFDVSTRRLIGKGLVAGVLSIVLRLQILGMPDLKRGWRKVMLGCGVATVLIIKSAARKFLDGVDRTNRLDVTDADCPRTEGERRQMIQPDRQGPIRDDAEDGLHRSGGQQVVFGLKAIIAFQRLPIRLYNLARRVLMFLQRLMRFGAKAAWYVARIMGLVGPESPSAARLRRSRLLHTMACGDFTLLSRNDWFRLRGYAEWPIFSWHLDSLFLFAASAHDIREVALGAKHRAYHIDHSSGWTLAGNDALFSRLREKGVPFLTDADLQRHQKTIADDVALAVFNNSNWGLSDYDLPERRIGPCGKIESETITAATSRQYESCATSLG